MKNIFIFILMMSASIQIINANIPANEVRLAAHVVGGDYLFMENQNEVWKDIAGYEGYYQVSNLGNIKSMSRVVFAKSSKPKTLHEKQLRLNYCSSGYVRVVLQVEKKPKTIFVHRLVASAFLSNPENKKTVNHKNGIRNDNRLENLEWNTQSENILHKFRVLGYKQGKGASDSQSIPINQYSRDNILLNEFGSFREAQTETKVFKAAILKCLKGEYSQAGGFIWKYKNAV